MRFHILGTETSPISRTDWAIVKRIFAVLLGILVSTTILDGQQTETGTDADTQTIKALMRRIEQLEAADKQLKCRVEQIEKVQQALAQPSITQLPTHLSVSSEAPANEQSAALEPEKSDADETLLNIRGFGDYRGNAEMSWQLCYGRLGKRLLDFFELFDPGLQLFICGLQLLDSPHKRLYGLRIRVSAGFGLLPIENGGAHQNPKQHCKNSLYDRPVGAGNGRGFGPENVESHCGLLKA